MASERETRHLDAKLQRLEGLLQSYGHVAVGFSGGVNSTFLAAVCRRCMPERTLLVHLATPFIGTPESDSFERETERIGLPTLTLEMDPIAEPRIAANPPDRCYRCKLAGFTRIAAAARERGYATVVDGSNADDDDETRPGMRALRELGVRSPLKEAGWHKEEERTLLQAWGHPVWNLPAGACLATRIPCGEALTAEKLELVRRCEDYLHGLGLQQVRVRLDNGCARVSAAPEDLMRLRDLENAEASTAHNTNGGKAVPLPKGITEALRSLGVQTVDPIACPYQYGATSLPASRA